MGLAFHNPRFKGASSDPLVATTETDRGPQWSAYVEGTPEYDLLVLELIQPGSVPVLQGRHLPRSLFRKERDISIEEQIDGMWFNNFFAGVYTALVGRNTADYWVAAAEDRRKPEIAMGMERVWPGLYWVLRRVSNIAPRFAMLDDKEFCSTLQLAAFESVRQRRGGWSPPDDYTVFELGRPYRTYYEDLRKSANEVGIDSAQWRTTFEAEGPEGIIGKPVLADACRRLFRRMLDRGYSTIRLTG